MDVNKRTLHSISEPRAWLNTEDAKQIVRASRLPGVSLNGKAATNWWGVYHRTSEHMSTELTLPKKYGIIKQAHRAFFADHTYLWDHQAMEGRKTEVLLQQLPKFRHIAALLISPQSMGEQHLVLAGPNGWHEPTAREQHKAEQYLGSIVSLAHAEVEAATIVDNRGGIL
jgi:hypothetical protein